MLDKIKALCKNEGISVSQLEQLMGFGSKAIYKWDEQTPGIDRVKKVADHFGVSVDYLLSDDLEYDEREALMQKLFDGDPTMRILFSAAQGVKTEDLLRVAKMIEALKQE